MRRAAPHEPTYFHLSRTIAASSQHLADNTARIRAAMPTWRNHVPGYHTAFGTSCNNARQMVLAGTADPGVALPVTYTLTNGHPGAAAGAVRTAAAARPRLSRRER